MSNTVIEMIFGSMGEFLTYSYSAIELELLCS